MNSPTGVTCVRCTHDVATSHMKSHEFICARAVGDSLICGSCMENVAREGASRGGLLERSEALSRHFEREHPELATIRRFRERAMHGARFLFAA